MYSLKLKNITRRNLLPTTCQSMWNVRGTKLLSSKYIAARDEVEKGEKKRESEREYWHDEKELRKCSDRDTKPSFHRAAAYRRSSIDSSSYRYPLADTASSYISGDRDFAVLPIPLLSSVRFCPGEFQKRYFMRSLFNPRPFVIACRYRTILFVPAIA